MHREHIRRVRPTRYNFSQFIYFSKTLYVFQTVFPSFIRSSKLHIQRQAFVRPLLVPAASLARLERLTEINKLWNVTSCWLYSVNVFLTLTLTLTHAHKLKVKETAVSKKFCLTEGAPFGRTVLSRLTIESNKLGQLWNTSKNYQWIPMLLFMRSTNEIKSTKWKFKAKNIYNPNKTCSNIRMWGLDINK